MAHRQRPDVRIVSCAPVGSILFPHRISYRICHFFFPFLPSLKPVHAARCCPMLLWPTIIPSSLFSSGTLRISQSFAGNIVSEPVRPSSYFLNEGSFSIPFPLPFFQRYVQTPVFRVQRQHLLSILLLLLLSSSANSFFEKIFFVAGFCCPSHLRRPETMANSDWTRALQKLYSSFVKRAQRTQTIGEAEETEKYTMRRMRWPLICCKLTTLQKTEWDWDWKRTGQDNETRMKAYGIAENNKTAEYFQRTEAKQKKGEKIEETKKKLA